MSVVVLHTCIAAGVKLVGFAVFLLFGVAGLQGIAVHEFNLILHGTTGGFLTIFNGRGEEG